MKSSDLRFNILTAAALGVVIILAPTAGRAADEASGLYLVRGLANPASIPAAALPALWLRAPTDVDCRSELQILNQ
jgi:hypothetical protein